MTISEPTGAQIKEFWEWCGLIWGVGGGWFEPIPKTYLGDSLPIDLNNLFLYAVPKLLLSSDKINYYVVIREWYQILLLHQVDPALALFWIIWEVRRKGQLHLS